MEGSRRLFEDFTIMEKASTKNANDIVISLILFRMHDKLQVHDGITFQGADIICPELRLLCEGDVLGVEV